MIVNRIIHVHIDVKSSITIKRVFYLNLDACAINK